MSERPSRLRTAILILGGLYLAVAAVLFVFFRVSVAFVAYLAVAGAVLVVSMLVEHRRYRPRRRGNSGHWVATGERFIDPTTGSLTEVRYNPSTGEREYVELPPTSK